MHAIIRVSEHRVSVFSRYRGTRSAVFENFKKSAGGEGFAFENRCNLAFERKHEFMKQSNG